jgi:hypothetical protein
MTVAFCSHYAIGNHAAILKGYEIVPMNQSGN